MNLEWKMSKPNGAMSRPVANTGNLNYGIEAEKKEDKLATQEKWILDRFGVLREY